MKQLFIILAVIISAIASEAQQPYQRINAYGYEWKRGKFDSSAVVPHDTIHLDAADSGSIAFVGGRMWQWSGYVWDQLKANVSKLNDSTLLVGADTVKVGGTGGSSFVTPGNDQDIIYNDAGSPGADDNLTYSKSFRAICLGCNVTYGNASLFGGGLTNGAFDIASNQGLMRITGDTATVQVRVGSANMFRVVTNNTERLGITNAGELKINGASGTAGQVPMSAGAGSATVWGTAVTPPMLSDSMRAILSNIPMEARIEFIQSGSSSTYHNDSLIGAQISICTLEGYQLGFIPRPTAYMSFNSVAGTITLTNANFTDDDHVIIIYRTTPIFLVDGSGNYIKDGSGNYIILN